MSVGRSSGDLKPKEGGPVVTWYPSRDDEVRNPLPKVDATLRPAPRGGRTTKKWAFVRPNGKRAAANDFKQGIFEELEWIQENHPELIDPKVDVWEDLRGAEEWKTRNDERVPELRCGPE